MFSLMRRTLIFCAILLVQPFSATAQQAALPADALPATHATVDDVVARVKPALVRIHVVSTDYQEGREIKYESSGSGVIITKEGHVVTNHHVAGHATRLFCTLSNREEIEADVVGTDALSDIAVIKLKAAEGVEFPTAVFGDSDQVSVGDRVLAMGSPMALSQSVTLGIVSNTEMIMPDWIRAWGGLEQDGEDIGSLVKWIGHDAEIAGGNSGGPLVNLAGEIVGINEIQMALGGAIPGNLAKSVAEQIIAKGAVARAWLGISIQPRLKHNGTDRGVLISGVMSDTPASEAGILAGDFLLKVGEQPVDARFDEQIPDINRMIAALPIGQEVELVVLREGTEMPLRVKPIEREKARPKEHELKPWGITASDLSFVVSKEMKRKNQDGVLVTSVRPGGPAGEAKPGITARAVLVEVDGKPVKNLRELLSITAKLTEGQSEPVPVLTAFERGTQRFLTVVKVGIKELDDPGLEVKKAWLPVDTQVLTRDIAERMGRKDLTGFCVTQVFSGSTGEKAGIETGDFILAVDDEKLTASAPEHYEELDALIRQYEVGAVVNLKVLRRDQELTIPVELVRAPRLDREMKVYRDESFELTVRDVGFFDRARQQWKPEQTGVLISEITPGGWAALGKVNVGDLLLSIDNTATTDVAGFEAKMKEIAEKKPDSVVWKVLRGIYTLYIELEPKWNDKE